MTPREILRRLRAWSRRRELDAQLRTELEHHVELLARDIELEEHRSATDARVEARRRLGNTTALRESSGDAWGFPAVDAFVQDLRYAWRGLLHAPAFTATIVLTLGLGIGANAAMFAVIDRLMLRPFPYMKDPGTVHRVYTETNATQRFVTSVIPYTRYLDLVRNTRALSEHAAVSEWRVAVGTGQATVVRKLAGVSASFFALFDARPVRGRFFGPGEDQVPLGAMVAVLSHDLWASAFGSRDVIGEALRVGSLDYTIIGVAPPGFVGTVQGRPPEIFVPITTIPENIDRSNRLTYFSAYNWDWVEVIARRAPGVSPASADAELTESYRRSRRIQRETNPRVLPDSIARPRAMVAALRGPAGPDRGPEARVLLWVAGVAVVVLVIACANVANLMFARVLRRRREIAVRLALGVSRTRLVLQFVIEAVLLATMGVAAGLLFAQWGGSGIRSLLLPEGSTFFLATDWRTIGVAGAVAFTATLLTAIGPALMASRADLHDALKSGARAGAYRRSRTRATLLVIQGALSVVLLVGAGLFVRSLRNVQAIPLGWDASRVIEVYPDLRGQEFDTVQLAGLRRRLLETAEAIPGVEAAARVNSILFRTNVMNLRVPGVDSVEALGRFNAQVATTRYFDVMRTRILRGRRFTPSDDRRAPPVAVVSAAMARTLWPGRDAIGECMFVAWTGGPSRPPCTTVVGVAEDVATRAITDDVRYLYYLNAEQMDAGWASMLYVRLVADPTPAAVERVRHDLQAVMPGDGFVVVRELQRVVDDQHRSWRLGSTLFVAFGGLALVVAAVGLYGVISYTVAQRMPELAMRVALGATRGHVLRLVLKQGIMFAGAGVAIGVAVAAAAVPWLEPLLYRQPGRDPSVYLAVCGVMLAAGLAASLGPARRAIRADPARSLRLE